MELENYCALTNSNIKFLSCMRSFIESIQETTGYPLEELQKSFQQQFLMKKFAELASSSYQRIQDLVKQQIAEAFLGITDYRVIVIVKCIIILAKVRRGLVHGAEDHLRETLPELLQEAVEVHPR